MKRTINEITESISRVLDHKITLKEREKIALILEENWGKKPTPEVILASVKKEIEMYKNLIGLSQEVVETSPAFDELTDYLNLQVITLSNAKEMIKKYHRLLDDVSLLLKSENTQAARGLYQDISDIAFGSYSMSEEL